MDGYRHQELSDETLEKDIEAALGVDPSPEFLPRVRARIANERMQRRLVLVSVVAMGRGCGSCDCRSRSSQCGRCEIRRVHRVRHTSRTHRRSNPRTPPVEPARRVPDGGCFVGRNHRSRRGRLAFAPCVRRESRGRGSPRSRHFTKRGYGATATGGGNRGPAGRCDGYPAARGGIGAPSAD